MKDDYFKDFKSGNRDYANTLNGNGNLETYVAEKIPEIIALDKEISRLQTDLTGCKEHRKHLVRAEIEYLRKMTGLDAVMTKAKVLSEISNDKLKEDDE